MSTKFHILYIYQFYSIIHQIKSSFDYKPPTDIRAIFIDMLKAFDKMWHQGLLLKLKSNGVERNLLRLLENCLDNRKQSAILDGHCSPWKIILSGVPQSSVLGPLLFRINLNDLANGLSSTCKIFTDDTSIISKVLDKSISR